MSQQNRTILKSYFRTGKKPTQEQFAELIDSGLNLADSDLYEADGSLGLGHEQPLARLSVSGNLSVSPNNDSAPDNGLFVHGRVGIGTGFTDPAARLAVNGGVYIGDSANTDPGQNGLRVDGNVAAGGDLTLDNNKYIAADKVRARDDSGLTLSEAGGKGLSVSHGSGDIEADGHLRLADGKRLKTDWVQARDNGGLKISSSNGTGGMKIHDNGNVSIGTDTDSWAKMSVNGSVLASSIFEAKSLKLTGETRTTEWEGSTGGSRSGGWTLDVPDNRVVTGLKIERWRSGESDKDYYRFALLYKI